MKRIGRILKYIIQSKQFVKLDELADAFNISVRTVREDIIAIETYLNENNVLLEHDRKNGYYIDTNQIENQKILDLIKNIGGGINYYSDEERFKIILQTLLSLNGTITFDMLCEKVMVSKTTIIKDFEKVQEWLLENNLFVKKKQRVGISIVYRELDWRKATLEYLMSNMKDIDMQSWINSNFSVLLIFEPIIDEFMNSILKGTNPERVSNFIHKYENDFNVKFSSNYYIVLLLYICISLNRICRKNIIDKQEIDINYSISSACIDWMKNNKHLISNDLDKEISESEFDLIMLYLSGAQKVFESNRDSNELKMFDVEEIVSNFIANIESILSVSFSSDEDLYQSLIRHVAAAIHRIMYNIKFNNPLKTDINSLYPEIYKACKKSIQFLERKLGKQINEDEISFLTMYIGAAVEKIKRNLNSIFFKIIVVCADGVGASRLLCSRLLNEFSDLYVENVVAVDQLSSIDLSDVDMIITTVPLFSNISVPTVKVSPVLSGKDILRIKKEMKLSQLINKDEKISDLIIKDLMTIVTDTVPNVDYSQLKEQLGNYFNRRVLQNANNVGGIRDYLYPELIELNIEVDSWKEAVEYGGNLLYRQGYIEKAYIAKMIQIIEDMGNYILISEGVVMPHGKPVDGVLKTGFSFITLKEPIYFGDDRDNLISMVITLAADESMIHLKAIADIADLLDEKFLKDVLMLKNKTDFIDYVNLKLEEK